MIRVLQVVNCMSYGGIETFIMNIYRNINREEIQFDFAVATNKKGEYDDEIRLLGGKIYYLPKRREGIKKYNKEWKEFLSENKQKYNAIHMHSSSISNIQPIKIAKKIGMKNRYIHAHNTHQKGIMHNILNKINKQDLLKQANHLFACSTEAGKYCFGRNKFEVLTNGIQAENFCYNEKVRKEKRKEFQLEEKNLAIINVARFSEQKNHIFLIDIFKQIYKINNNARLFLIGNGILKEQIEEKVKQLELSNVVYFLNSRNDVNEILQAMDIFLMPSLHEGLPVSGIEAQASGLPTYVSNTVSPELKITNLVNFYSLEDSAAIWAKNILQSIKKYKRENKIDAIIKSGYDIKNTTQILEKYYLK